MYTVKKNSSMGQIQAIIATDCCLIFPLMEDSIYWEVCRTKLDFFTLLLMKGYEEKKILVFRKRSLQISKNIENEEK